MEATTSARVSVADVLFFFLVSLSTTFAFFSHLQRWNWVWVYHHSLLCVFFFFRVVVSRFLFVCFAVHTAKGERISFYCNFQRSDDVNRTDTVVRKLLGCFPFFRFFFVSWKWHLLIVWETTRVFFRALRAHRVWVDVGTHSSVVMVLIPFTNGKRKKEQSSFFFAFSSPKRKERRLSTQWKRRYLNKKRKVISSLMCRWVSFLIFTKVVTLLIVHLVHFLLICRW